MIKITKSFNEFNEGELLELSPCLEKILVEIRNLAVYVETDIKENVIIENNKNEVVLDSNVKSKNSDVKKELKKNALHKSSNKRTRKSKSRN